MRLRLLPLLSLFAALAVVAAACGDASGGDGAAVSLAGQPDLPAVTTAPAAEPTQPEGAAATAPDETAAPATDPTAAGEPPPSDLPDVTVVNLAGGEVELASLAPSDRPILLWFWAPH